MVFISYGKERAKLVADQFRRELIDLQLFKPFLATRSSPDLLSGDMAIGDRDTEITKNLLNSHVMVFVHAERTTESEPAHNEVKLAIENGISIIPFIQQDQRSFIFPELQSYWSPLEFDINRPQQSFDGLKYEILRVVLRKSAIITAREVDSP